jgi:hypothetical protein
VLTDLNILQDEMYQGVFEISRYIYRTFLDERYKLRSFSICNFLRFSVIRCLLGVLTLVSVDTALLNKGIKAQSILECTQLHMSFLHLHWPDIGFLGRPL